VSPFLAGVVFAYVAPWSVVGLVVLLAYLLRRRRDRRAIDRLIGERRRRVWGTVVW